MHYVLTLIADPDRRDLDAPKVAKIAEALRSTGAKVGEVVWLAPGLACDLPFDGLPPERVEKLARSKLGRAPVDVAVQPIDGRRKRLLMADMESTVIRNEMLDELAEFVGLRERVAAITAQAMRGELDFRDALRERVALLEGLPVAVLEEAFERVEIDPGAAALVATSRSNGMHTVLVTGGFGFFARRVAVQLGFDALEANELEIVATRLTGRVVEPILDRGAKLAMLEQLCAERNFSTADAVAVGDGANDVPMLRAAGLGVAYRAKPAVAAAARVRIDHGDLSALLYLQGFREAEINTGD